MCWVREAGAMKALLWLLFRWGFWLLFWWWLLLLLPFRNTEAADMTSSDGSNCSGINPRLFLNSGKVRCWMSFVTGSICGPNDEVVPRKSGGRSCQS